MKTRKIYRNVLIRNEAGNELRKVKAKRVILNSCPHRLFFAFKSDYYKLWNITEAYSGVKVIQSFHQIPLKDVIEQANDKIKNQVPKKYRSFDEFVEDYIIRENILPLRTNLKAFN